MGILYKLSGIRCFQAKTVYNGCLHFCIHDKFIGLPYHRPFTHRCSRPQFHTTQPFRVYMTLIYNIVLPKRKPTITINNSYLTFNTVSNCYDYKTIIFIQTLSSIPEPVQFLPDTLPLKTICSLIQYIAWLPAANSYSYGPIRTHMILFNH